MVDEILNKALAGDATAIPRFNLIDKNGATLHDNVRIELVNTVAQVGTPYNKESVLPDQTALNMNLTDSATPADAFGVLATLSSFFNLNNLPEPRLLRAGHTANGTGAYWGIRDADLKTRVYLGFDPSTSGLAFYNASGNRRIFLSRDDAYDSSQLALDDELGYGLQLGTSWDTDHTTTHRGIWIRGSNGDGVLTHLGHNVQSGTCYFWMKYGTSATNQVYMNSTEAGGRITLRQANNVVAVEIFCDSSVGGQIKLYNADGTLKQTIG